MTCALCGHRLLSWPSISVPAPGARHALAGFSHFCLLEIYETSRISLDHHSLPNCSCALLFRLTLSYSGLHTIIRNRDTPRDEFVFYSARLMRLLVEFALSFLPHETIEIETPQGINYIGSRVEHKSTVCGWVFTI